MQALGLNLGPSWLHLGPFCSILSPSWLHVGSILAPSWPPHSADPSPWADPPMRDFSISYWCFSKMPSKAPFFRLYDSLWRFFLSSLVFLGFWTPPSSYFGRYWDQLGRPSRIPSATWRLLGRLLLPLQPSELSSRLHRS